MQCEWPASVAATFPRCLCLPSSPPRKTQTDSNQQRCVQDEMPGMTTVNGDGNSGSMTMTMSPLDAIQCDVSWSLKYTHTHTLVKWLPDKSNWVYQRHPVCVNNLMRLWIMLLERGQGRVTFYSINYLSKLCERTKIYQNISNIYHNIRIYII